MTEPENFTMTEVMTRANHRNQTKPNPQNQSAPKPTNRSLGLTITLWSILAILLVLASIGTLQILNNTIYSASSFVNRYLEAIADDDITAALEMSGVPPSAEVKKSFELADNTSTALLRAGLSTTRPSQIKILSDTVHEKEQHLITASYNLDEKQLQTVFTVEAIDPLYGAIKRWRFARSPLAVLKVTSATNPLFTVGGITLDTRLAKPPEERKSFSQTAAYLVFAPASYKISYTASELLLAAPQTILANPGTSQTVRVVAQATDNFVKRVQMKLNDYLDQCANQPVLKPAGCPLGIDIEDRVLGAPKWSITQKPTATLTPGANSFVMPLTPALAEVTTRVQSLFDGSVTDIVQKQPFEIGLNANIQSDGTISIRIFY